MPESEDPIEDELYHKLFRIFSFFADSRENSCSIYEKEAHFILDELLREQGKPNTSSIACSASESISFRELLAFIDVLIPDRESLEPLVERLFERLLTQVIQKGFLLFRRRASRGCFPSTSSWIPSWCTLAPGAIHIYPLDKKLKSSNRKTLVFDKEATVSFVPSCESESLFEWRVQHSKHSAAFAHFDPLQRTAFVQGMRLAICLTSTPDLMRYDLLRASRNEGRAEREAEMRATLEKENKRLTRDLETERQALKDEEIVRGLATRMLEEEKQKNEQMEQVLAELQQRLDLPRSPLPRSPLLLPSAVPLPSHYTDRGYEEDDEDSMPAPPPPLSPPVSPITPLSLRKGRQEQRVRRKDGREADDEAETADDDVWSVPPHEHGHVLILSTTSI